jgi:hypothetical protein
VDVPSSSVRVLSLRARLVLVLRPRWHLALVVRCIRRAASRVVPADREVLLAVLGSLRAERVLALVHVLALERVLALLVVLLACCLVLARHRAECGLRHVLVSVVADSATRRPRKAR